MGGGGGLLLYYASAFKVMLEGMSVVESMHAVIRHYTFYVYHRHIKHNLPLIFLAVVLYNSIICNIPINVANYSVMECKEV